MQYVWNRFLTADVDMMKWVSNMPADVIWHGSSKTVIIVQFCIGIHVKRNISHIVTETSNSSNHNSTHDILIQQRV